MEPPNESITMVESEESDVFDQIAENDPNGNRYFQSMKKILEVNKSYEEAAQQSMEKYQKLKDMCDDAMEKFRTASENTTALQSEISDCEIKIKKLEKQNKTLKNNATKDRLLFNNEKAEAEASFSTLQGRYTKLKDLYRSAIDEARTLKDDLNTLQLDVEKRDLQMKQLDAANENLKATYAKEREAFGIEKEESEKYTLNLKESLRNEETLRSQILNDLEHFHQLVEEKKKEITEMEKEKKNFDDKFNRLKKSLKSVETVKDNLILVESKLTNQLREQTEENQEDKATIDHLTKLNENLELKISEEKSKAKDRIDTLVKQREEDRVISESLKDQINKLTSELDSTKSSYDQDTAISKTEIDGLAKQIQELKDSNEKNANEFTERQEKYEEYIANLDEKLSNEVEQNKTLNKQIDEAKMAMIQESKNHELEIEGHKKALTIVEKQFKSAMKRKVESDEVIETLKRSLECEKALREKITNELDTIQQAVLDEMKKQEVETSRLQQLLKEAQTEKEELSARLIQDVIKYENVIKSTEDKNKEYEETIKQLKRGHRDNERKARF